MNKNGQAAMEFLLTYGWAILILLGALAVFVFMTPHTQSLTRNNCIFSPKVSCLGLQLSSDNLTVALRNGIGQNIYSLSGEVISPKNTSCNIFTASKTETATLAVLNPDETMYVVCPNNGSMDITADSKITMKLKYKKTKSGYESVLMGEMYAKYQ